jgi:GNAT superfamily N-acetyltransferase
MIPHYGILVVEKVTGEIVGGGIADYDAEIHELILEWIQVLPDYRRKGIGRAIVNELLIRKQNKADLQLFSGEWGIPPIRKLFIENADSPAKNYWPCPVQKND